MLIFIRPFTLKLEDGRGILRNPAQSRYFLTLSNIRHFCVSCSFKPPLAVRHHCCHCTQAMLLNATGNCGIYGILKACPLYFYVKYAQGMQEPFNHFLKQDVLGRLCYSLEIRDLKDIYFQAVFFFLVS